MNYLDPEKVKYIVVHCSDTKPGQPCNARIINDWHRQRGFEMIGYHAVILPDGTIEPGRPLYYQGAHVHKRYAINCCSVGICYVGGRNEQGVCADTRTEQQKRALIEVIKTLQRRYPQARVVGHRYFDKGKECPCFNAEAEYNII